ncbi:stage III sporulation protein AB [uncultured Oscillibacter sp.]|uniref:stage III sporulation protein AB n=1 Tax=uncultured Oscillibacter sp. TaxID=876091 RepID=UPI002610D63F|nr:stage III sporulation protein AB [uncultured Oscillibacter sp.]
MLTKLLGGLFVLLGGGLGRWAQMAERRRRRDTLSDFITALRRMGESVRMTRTPLPVLLERLSADCGRDAAVFLRGAAEAARQGEDLPARWRRLTEALPLAGGDRAALAGLGRDLQGDEEKVCKAIALVTIRLEQSASEAEGTRRAEEQRVSALWFSAAALLVILLI